MNDTIVCPTCLGRCEIMVNHDEMDICPTCSRSVGGMVVSNGRIPNPPRKDLRTLSILKKEYTDRLIADLKRGVQHEEFGDMETDVYSTEQVMTRAAETIKQMARRIRELENKNG